MRVLGIDPALNKTGWGVVDLAPDKALRYIASGIIKVSAGDALFEKLRVISSEVIEVINCYAPDDISIEEIFVNRNPSTSLKLGHARGAIMVSCLSGRAGIYEYGANQIKKTICGAGKADKSQVSMMVKQILPQASWSYDDESDALAAAICHIHHKQFYHKIAS